MQMHNSEKFDALRGASALVVLAAHVFQIYWLRFFGPEHPYRYVSSTMARHAVVVFFLLSGYLITLSIIRNKAKHGSFVVTDYAASRIARIYPPVLGSMAVLAVCNLVITHFGLPGALTPYGVAGDSYAARDFFSVNYLEVASALLLVDGLGVPNAPLWSLYFEAWLYVIAGIVGVACFSKSTRSRVIAGGTATLLAAILVAYKATFFFYGAVWFLGATACIITHFRRGDTPGPIVWPPIVFVPGLLAILLTMPSALLVGSSDNTTGFLALGLFSLAYAHLMFFWRGLDRLRSRLLLKIGGFSYSLYITHFPLLLLGLSLSQDWMGRSIPHTATASTLTAIGSVAIAWKFAQIFERPVCIRNSIQATLGESDAIRQN